METIKVDPFDDWLTDLIKGFMRWLKLQSNLLNQNQFKDSPSKLLKNIENIFKQCLLIYLSKKLRTSVLSRVLEILAL